MCSGYQGYWDYTSRVNRLNNTPLPPAKSMEKKASGTMEVYSTDISAVRSVDNKVVTLPSNNLNQSHFKTAASVAVWRTKSHHPSTISYKTVQ